MKQEPYGITPPILEEEINEQHTSSLHVTKRSTITEGLVQTFFSEQKTVYV